MVEAAAQLDYPTSRGEVVQWFAEHYPQVKASTIRAHIVGLTANDRSRHHYPSLARREPLFTRHLDGSLGAFEALDEDEADEAEHLDVAATPPLEFALEAFLEEFILTNWDGIDWDVRWSSGNRRPTRSAISWRRRWDAWTSFAGTPRQTRSSWSS